MLINRPTLTWITEPQYWMTSTKCRTFNRVRVTEATVITARAALPQIRVETLIGSQAEFEITN